MTLLQSPEIGGNVRGSGSISTSKRMMDVLLAGFLLFILFVPLLIIGVLVILTSPGPALYWSERVGLRNKIFMMPKFRTMRRGTPVVATHLLRNPDAFVTPIGRFLRRASLDELPQLFSILRGELSFVGPRPALYNQDDLIALRTSRGIDQLVPGLTGWAQVNGRDELPIPIKVEFDAYYKEHQSLVLDLKILLLTVLRVVRADGVQH